MGRVRTMGVAVGLAVSGILGSGLAPAGAQEGGEGTDEQQRAQAEVPEDWAARAGVCRRTVAGCEGRSTAATKIREGEAIEVDARLNETVWQRARWVDDFIQMDPVEGASPTVRTEVAFAYDGSTLYVAGRMYDPRPSQIRANLARRDQTGASDRLTIAIDSYLSRRTSYTFTVTAAGGRADHVTTGDSRQERDDSYDPVWSTEARITPEGWIAEMAIPFSQLRYNASEEVVFGVNAVRYVASRSEEIYWAPVPRDEDGWTSWFADLEGLRGIESDRPVEVVPYAASNLRITSDELLDPENPFTDRSEVRGRAGADVKVGVGSSLTLDLAVNPDFGQVEADPAEVNLSAFPTFFRERRPFFVENAELLEAEGLFFSRRIGARPHGSPPGAYADVPEATTILGAAKLTGRTAGGLSLGALGAVTGEETAPYLDPDADVRGRARVEPATGWMVLRGLQEFGTANNTAGLAFTGVRRDLASGEPLAAILNREAYAGGADLQLEFHGGLTRLNLALQGSRIAGSPQAIERVQRFSSHYFQRPDAGHVELDPSRTTLSGYRAEMDFSRRDGDHWAFEAYGNAVSPGFDINDAGALSRADRMAGGVDLAYTENRVGTFRTWSTAAELEGTWNYAGDRLFTELELRGRLDFRNFWTLGGEIDLRPGGVSDVQTRGGPLMGSPDEIGGVVYWNTDTRRRLDAGGFFYWERDELGGWTIQTGTDVDYRPGGAWQFSVTPVYLRRVETRQYVTALDGGPPETFGRRYVFGRIDRHRVSAEIRTDFAFSPELTLEAYVQPFVATGRYSDFGELRRPGSTALRLYGTEGTTIRESEGGAPRTLTVTDGEDVFSFRREDFRSPSFRSNLVLRWQWRPGSTLFVVWQLDRGGFGYETAPDPAGVGGLVDTPDESGRSFFAVKATYWLPI